MRSCICPDWPSPARSIPSLWWRERRDARSTRWTRRGHCDRCKVLEGIVRDIGVEARIDHEAAGGDEHRVSVGRGTRDCARADVSARAGDILHIDLLAPALRQLLRDEPR